MKTPLGRLDGGADANPSALVAWSDPIGCTMPNVLTVDATNLYGFNRTDGTLLQVPS